VAENFTPGGDHDIYGGFGSFNWQNLLWEFGYIDDRDFSGTTYVKGVNRVSTTQIDKQYYDFRLGRKEKEAEFQLEFVKQNGIIQTTTDTGILMDATSLLAYGRLIGEKTKLGKVTAHTLLSVNSGDPNMLAITSTDGSFSPNLTRKYDGLERLGYGALFGATPTDAFFALPEYYSGINTLSVGADFSPVYEWTFGATYFLYSASQGPRGAPDASGFEKLFGAQYSIGVEMDLTVKYTFSKYSDISFCYARYTPPNFAILWPHNDPAGRYELAFTAKF